MLYDNAQGRYTLFCSFLIDCSTSLHSPLLASKQGSSIPKHAHSTKDFWTPSSYLNSQAASAFLASQTLSWSPTCMHSVFHNSLTKYPPHHGAQSFSGTHSSPDLSRKMAATVLGSHQVCLIKGVCT